MPAVASAVPLFMRYFLYVLVGKCVVHHCTDAADRETEDQTFNVEAGALRKIEQTLRIPVFRHEDRLADAEQTGRQTDAQHLPAETRLDEIQPCPRNQECNGPNQPHVTHGVTCRRGRRSNCIKAPRSARRTSHSRSTQLLPAKNL